MGVLFGMVAGIMVYISLDELLPTSMAYGREHENLLGLPAGMAVMGVSLVLLSWEVPFRLCSKPNGGRIPHRGLKRRGV